MKIPMTSRSNCRGALLETTCYLGMDTIHISCLSFALFADLLTLLNEFVRHYFDVFLKSVNCLFIEDSCT